MRPRSQRQLGRCAFSIFRQPIAARPIIDGIEKDFAGKIAVERYDAASDDGKKLMGQYEIKVTPSYVMAASDGTKLWSLTGVIHKDMLRQQVQAKAQ